MSLQTYPAILAAGRASSALVELMRFALDGDGLPGFPFGTQDPTVELAHAIIAIARIERDALCKRPGNDWESEIASLGKLTDACQAYLGEIADGAAA